MAGHFNGPVDYAQAIARAVLAVEKKLNVKIEAQYGGRDKCIFLRIVEGSYYNVTIDTLNNVHISGRYLKNSHDCLNINGLDYYRIEWEQITLATCIGVNHSFYNEWLYPRFFKLESEHSNLSISKFCAAHYPDCTFIRAIRIKHGNGMPIYAFVPLNDDNISFFQNYLWIVRQCGVYISKLTPKECADRLQEFGVPHDPKDKNDPYEKLKRYRFSDYGWLEYTHIYTPILNFKLIRNEDPEENKKLEEHIEFHVKLMLLIDHIDQHITVSPWQGHHLLPLSEFEFDGFRFENFIEEIDKPIVSMDVLRDIANNKIKSKISDYNTYPHGVPTDKIFPKFHAICVGDESFANILEIIYSQCLKMKDAFDDSQAKIVLCHTDKWNFDDFNRFEEKFKYFNKHYNFEFQFIMFTNQKNKILMYFYEV